MGDKKREKIYLILIVVFLVAIIISIAVWNSGRNKTAAPELPELTGEPDSVSVTTELEGFTAAEKNITAQIIEDGLHDIGQLICQEYFFTEVISYSDVKKLFGEIALKFTESSYLISYDGVVSAGIDLAQIDVELDELTRTVKLTVPASRVTSVTIDNDSLIVYNEKNGVGNPISIADYNQSLIQLKSTAKDKAIAKGILDASDENAKKLVKSFAESIISGSGYSLDIKVKE